MLRRAQILLPLLLLCLAQLWPAARSTAPTARYIVELHPTVGDSAAIAREIAGHYDLKLRYLYQHALQGFSADVPARSVARLAADPRVARVTPDTVGQLLGTARATQLPVSRAAGQMIPAGIRRIGADRSPVARIDGVDTPLDVDIAVVDSGVDGSQPDLNVYRSVACANGTVSEQATAEDLTGHGTAVANVLAARDNGTGVVGVAPGARLWSIRVATRGPGSRVGYGVDDLICGVDWLASHSHEIDVANISLGSYAADGLEHGQCGIDSTSPVAALHRAVCAAVDGGITVVVAAGEARPAAPRSDAANVAPAGFDEAITVSAMADFDGRPGGSGRRAACITTDRDDTLADDSNYGAAVDLPAPGVCVATGAAAYWSGTSFAAPHVAGAAALYKVLRPAARPAEVKAALLASAVRGWNSSATAARPQGDDPDTAAEPLLNVAALAPPVAEQRGPQGTTRVQ